MGEDKFYMAFGIIGLILVITGAIVSIFSREMEMTWTLVGSGLTLIWISLHKVYHGSKRKEK